MQKKIREPKKKSEPKKKVKLEKNILRRKKITAPQKNRCLKSSKITCIFVVCIVQHDFKYISFNRKYTEKFLCLYNCTRTLTKHVFQIKIIKSIYNRVKDLFQLKQYIIEI